MFNKKSIFFPIVSLIFSGLSLLLFTSPLFSQTIEIQFNQPQQTIDGFGASGAFRQAENLKGMNATEVTKILDLLFSPTTGVGISIVRNMVGDGSTSEWGNSIDGPIDTIEPTKGTWNYNAADGQIWFMQEAKKRGVNIFVSTVWSPPRWMKTNNSCINGGSLSTSAYADFATYLVNYVVEYMKNRNGIDIYGISPSNEPDMSVGYSCCLWSADQFNTFIKNNLGPHLRAAAPNTKIILGESSQWTEAPALTALNDATTVGYVDIVAAHNYGNSNYPKLTTASNKNKKVWETEISNLNSNDSSITDGLKWARQIHDFLVNAGGNSWSYWWAIYYKVGGSYPNSGEGLIGINVSNSTWVTNKRLYTFGNYSKFIRPGWVRLTTSTSTINQVSITAFKNPNSSECAMVAINQSGSTQAVQFHFNGNTITTVTPYVTSASSDLAKQAAITANASGVFSYTLAANSVTTFVGGQGTLKGDANGDGTVTVVDAMWIAQYCAGLNPSGFVAGNAEVDNDGQISIMDALKVARYCAGLIPSL
jgi:glucuronoarabinoxylan endo-1,4-beta-xylanase